MTLSFLLFLALIGATLGSGKLSPQENLNLQRLCGAKPINSIAKPNGFQLNSHRRSLYGGRAITGDMAPWAVQIDTPDLGTCSGTLISPRHILTASHCVWTDGSKQSQGVHYSKKECDGYNLILTQNNDLWKVYGSDGRPLSNKVSKMVFMNYCLQADWRYDDMMIWELQEDVIFNDYVHPACVLHNWQYANTNVFYLTGFGHDNWQFDNEDRSGTFRLRDGFMMFIEYTNEGRSFHLNGEKQKTVSRRGDSGSGAFITIDSRFFIVGVYSGGHTGFDAWYTSVPYHFNFICQYSGVCWG